MSDKFAEFTARLEAGDTALFCYVGHGVAIDNGNYLLPSDVVAATPGAPPQGKQRRAGVGGRELEGSTRNAADPQRSHQRKAGQPSQVLGVPFPQLRVLGLLVDDGGSSRRRR